jgi:hypothetical protein
MAAAAAAAAAAAVDKNRIPLSLRVRIWLVMSPWARRWEFLQIFLAFVACAILVSEFYVTTDPAFFLPIELIFSAFFLIDYLLHLFAALDRLRFFFHWRNLADLVSLMPVVVSLIAGNDDNSTVSHVLRTLRVVRALRIMRALRLLFVRRAGAGTTGTVKRQIAFIAISLLTLLFVLACFVFVVEQNFSDTPSLDTYHDALYWVVQLMTTVSFGDIVPKSTVSRMVVALVIIFSWLVMSVNLARLIALINTAQRFDGSARWGSEDGTPLVVVGGVVTYDSLHNVLRELLYSSTGRRRLRVIALLSSIPNAELISLSKDPRFESNLQLLVGSPLHKVDLERVRMQDASAVFLLTDKYARDVNAVDTSVILQAIAIADFSPNMRDKLFVQLLRRAATRHLILAGVPNVLSIDELKYGLLGQSCNAPGFSTLVTNLMRSHSPDKLAPPIGLPMQFARWIDEYEQGCAHQPWTVPLEPFAGEKFGHALVSLFVATGATIFAIETWENGRRRIVLKPDMTREVTTDDLAFYVSSKPLELTDELVRNMLVFGRRAFDSEHASFMRAQHVSESESVDVDLSDIAPASRRRRRRLTPVTTSFRDALPLVWQDEITRAPPSEASRRMPTQSRMSAILIDENEVGAETVSLVNVQPSASSRTSSVSARRHPHRFARHQSQPHPHNNNINNISNQQPSQQQSTAQQPLQESPTDTDTASATTGDESGVPRVMSQSSRTDFSDDDEAEGDFDDKLRDFLLLIVCGDAPNELFADVLAPVDRDTTIVVLFEAQPKKWQWSRILSRLRDFSDIHLVQADPIQFVTSTAVDDARQVVILNGARTAQANLSSTFDSLVVIVARALDAVPRADKACFVLAELAEGRNISFVGGSSDSLQKRSLIDDYMFWPHYAAGSVFTAAVLDALLCQVYLNPAVLAMTKLMIGSSQGPRVYSVALPLQFAGRRVSSLFVHLAARDMLLLGLYRRAGRLTSSYPYVYANASPNAMVDAGDRLFVLALQAPSEALMTQGAMESFDWIE